VKLVPVIPAKVFKKAEPPKKAVDTGGGFLLEDEPEASTSKPIVHEPGAVLDDDRTMCEECSREFMDSYLLSKFKKAVCDSCKSVFTRFTFALEIEVKMINLFT